MLLAVSQALGLETADTPRIATGFGGGMGGGGSACGALVGAVMAVGLAHGRTDGASDPQAARQRSLRVLRSFREAMGSDICRDLTGMDLSTPEGLRAYRESGVPEGVCRVAIATGARLAQEELAR